MNRSKKLSISWMVYLVFLSPVEKKQTRVKHYCPKTIEHSAKARTLKPSRAHRDCIPAQG